MAPTTRSDEVTFSVRVSAAVAAEARAYAARTQQTMSGVLREALALLLHSAEAFGPTVDTHVATITNGVTMSDTTTTPLTDAFLAGDPTLTDALLSAFPRTSRRTAQPLPFQAAQALTPLVEQYGVDLLMDLLNNWPLDIEEVGL